MPNFFVLCELTDTEGPDGTPGFKVTGAVHHEERAQYETEGERRFYVELEETSPGDWSPVQKNAHHPADQFNERR